MDLMNLALDVKLGIEEAGMVAPTPLINLLLSQKTLKAISPFFKDPQTSRQAVAAL